jgi:hypothetical protein
LLSLLRICNVFFILFFIPIFILIFLFIILIFFTWFLVYVFLHLLSQWWLRPFWIFFIWLTCSKSLLVLIAITLLRLYFKNIALLLLTRNRGDFTINVDLSILYISSFIYNLRFLNIKSLITSFLSHIRNLFPLIFLIIWRNHNHFRIFLHNWSHSGYKISSFLLPNILLLEWLYFSHSCSHISLRCSSWNYMFLSAQWKLFINRWNIYLLKLLYILLLLWIRLLI